MKDNSHPKKVAILQSNYIPWKGYFDIINSVDEFVLFDNVQYTKNDWRNRNLIKTRNGLEWITIPVNRASLDQKINETQISTSNWQKKHLNTLRSNYGKLKYFKDYFHEIEKEYLNFNTNMLSIVNEKLIKLINSFLDIKTNISRIDDSILTFDRNERLVEICKKHQAKEYLSGPAAKKYLSVDLFTKAGIKVVWIDYSNYPEYSQMYPPFKHEVTILDLIFNEGLGAINYMKSF